MMTKRPQTVPEKMYAEHGETVQDMANRVNTVLYKEFPEAAPEVKAFVLGQIAEGWERWLDMRWEREKENSDR